jgi:hypothetical protein
MRRTPPFLFALATALVAFFSGDGRERPARPEAPTQPAAPPGEGAGLQHRARPETATQRTPRRQEVPALRYQGAASCAAAACHNANGPQGSRGSEYTTWMAHDPHSRAYTVLTEPRSYAIVKKYRRSQSVPEARPDHDALCRDCHVQPGLALLDRDERFSVADGVSCEACHGPAEKWLPRHHRDDWRRLNPDEKQALGMTDTRDVLARAEGCVGCHVGRGDADVNHDLIEAGHPRLRFEYAAYLARYPRHWRLGEDRRRYPDFDARAWEVGQLASAAVALELLRARAGRAGGAWPEFAESTCASCHHELEEPGARRERGAGERRRATPPWGTWYYPLLPVLARAAGGDGPEALPELEELRELMVRRRPDERRVAGAAGRAAASLRRWAAGRSRDAPDAGRLEKLLEGLAGQDDLASANWESAAQLYLALGAVHRGLDNLNPRRTPPELPGALRGLREELERAFPGGRESVYDSPRHFDPDALRRRLREVRQRLR